MTDEEDGVAHFPCDEIAQLSDQVRPISRDGISWIVPVLLDGVDCVALCLPVFKEHLVGVRRKTVGV